MTRHSGPYLHAVLFMAAVATIIGKNTGALRGLSTRGKSGCDQACVPSEIVSGSLLHYQGWQRWLPTGMDPRKLRV